MGNRVPEKERNIPQVICVGSVMVDTIVVVADRNVECMTLHNNTSSFLLLEQGRKIDALDISPHVGGGGANTAVAMRRLGGAVRLLATVGDDLNAKKARMHFETEKISTALIRVRPGAATGTSVLISSHDQNAAVFTHRGANTMLAPADIAAEMFAACDLLHIAPLSDESADCFPKLIQAARTENSFISVNPGIRQLTSRGGDFVASLSAVDLLSVNTIEAESLVPYLISNTRGREGEAAPLAAGAPPLLYAGFRVGGFVMTLQDFLERLHSLGPDYIIVTDGKAGSYLSCSGRLYYCPPVPTEVAGTAGAGDAFVATLAFCVSAGLTPQAGLCAAAVNAASVISHIDTQTGLLPMEKLHSHPASPADSIQSWPLGESHE